MTGKSIDLTDALYEYLLATSVRESELLRRLREETAKLELGRMQIAPDQGQLMHLLAELAGARRAIEIGVFTGYSSICVASALPTDGVLIACDVSEEWTAVARRYWREAGLEARIDLRLAPALQTLDALVDAGDAGRFDFVFIDADKEGYDAYYERSLVLLRAGGLVVVDNVLWGGSVIDEEDRSEDTRAIRALNEKIRDDDRVSASMLPVGDGITLARKR